MSSQHSHRRESAFTGLLLRFLLVLGLTLLSVPLLSAPSSAVDVGPNSIESDGDQDGLTNDWQGWQAYQNGYESDTQDSGFSIIRDLIGNADTTGITGQEKNWSEVGTQQAWEATVANASGKSDIGNVLIGDFRNSDDDLVTVIGFDRAGSGNGTQRYYFEFNQASYDSIRPTRTKGDMRIVLGENGNGTQSCKFAQLWTGTAWGPTIDCAGKVDFAVNGDESVTDYFNSPNADPDGTIPFNRFMELTANLTDLGATTCPVAGFRTFAMRAQEGNEDDEAGQLKDALWGPIDIPSDCGTIKIVKKDAATGDPITIPGTVFSISPDPTPGSDDEGPVYVKDNNGGPAGFLTDSSPAVGEITIVDVVPNSDPGYTVSEVSVPAPYAPPPEGCDDEDDTDRCTAKALGKGDVVTFSFTDKKLWDAPSITKTAHGSYDSRYTWHIRKTVAPDGEEAAEDDVSTEDVDESGQAEQAVTEGGSATFDYEVTLTGAETKGKYRVTGHVNVVNPNADPMTVTLTDAIENGDNDITCAFDDDTDGGSFSPSVPPTDMDAEPVVGTTYAYTCALTPEQAASEDLGDNQAWIEWNLDDYPQTEEQAWQENSEPGVPASGNPATASFDFAPPPANETGKTVVVTDTYDEFGGPHTVTFGEDEDNFVGDVYVVSWPYSVTFDGVPPGTCTDYDNTAEVRAQLAQGTALTVEQGELLDSDSATATVCVGSDLTVSKVTTTSLTREYPFTIEKTTPKSRVDVTDEAGTATVQYDVVVTDGAAKDSDWKMTSTVTVSNPNTWQDITLTSWDDVYRTTVNGQQVDLEPTCTPRDPGHYVVPEATIDGGVKTDGTLTIVLDCTFATKPPYDGTNRATVTWDAKAATTPNGSAVGTDPVVEADWTLDDEINKTVDVVDVLTEAGVPVDDTDLDLGTVTWQSAGHEHTAEEAGGDGPHAEFSYTRELEGTRGECVTYDNRASVMTQGSEPSVIDSDTATVKVCWQDDLDVSKTGAGTFWRTYDWGIEKSVLVGPAGEQTEVDAQTVKLDDPTLTHSFEYRVKAIPLPLAADADSGWYVEGTITVTNPNSSDVADSTEVTIIEQPDMGDGADCDVTDGVYPTEGDVDVTVTDGVVDLPAEDSVTVDYTCTFSAAPHGTQEDLYDGNFNQAKITWDGGEDTTAKTPVAFTLPEDQRTDWSVEVHDDKLDPTLLGTVAWDDDAKDRTFEYSLDHTGTAGECEPFPNTATVEHVTTTSFLVAGTAEALAQDSAEATVCVQKRLGIDSTVTTSFDRTYKWVIDKVADKHNAEVSGSSTAPFEYTVSVGPDTSVNDGAGYVDSGWAMAGTITVTNPNTEDIGSIDADLSDVTGVGGGATCLVEGEAVHTVTVPVGEAGVTVGYTCTFASKPAYTGTNTATATWELASGEPAHADSVENVTFEDAADPAHASPRETDRVIDVSDAFDGGAGTPVTGLQDLDWLQVKALPGGVKVVTYTRNLGASPGSCRTYPNVVTMFRDGTSTQVGLPAGESVSVCSQVGPTLVNGASASYDRAYAWDIAKDADGTEFSTGNDGTAEVSYTVTATPGAATDSGWTLDGSVQVSNPNTYKSLTVGLSPSTTVGGGAVCSLAAGQDMVVPASGSRTYAYRCTFTSQPSYVGTVSAAVSWGGGTASADAPVAFALDQETDKVVDVVDDQTDPTQSVALGTATWNAEGTPTVFTYSLDLAAEANDCQDYTNTASIVQTAQSDAATVTVCGPEILPEEEVVTPPTKPRPPTVKGVEAVIPSTGGPQLGLLWWGAGLVLAGGLLMAVRRRVLAS